MIARVFLTELVFSLLAGALGAREIVIEKDGLRVFSDPASLALQLVSAGKGRVPLFAPLGRPGKVTDLKQSDGRASWKLKGIATEGEVPAPDSKANGLSLQISLEVSTNGIALDFVTETTGILTLGRVAPGPAAKGWILPMFEGVYVPATNAVWRAFLAKGGTMDTTADWVMPFCGLDYGDETVTVILSNPFNNRIQFENRNNCLQMRLAHEFTSSAPKPRVPTSKSGSPG